MDHHAVVRERYQGGQGHLYHARKHSQSRFVLDIVARSRAQKFQPLVAMDDTVLEFGVGLGVNLLHLKVRRRVGYDLSDAGRELCEAAGIEYTTDPGALESAMFSVVICHHVLEHVPDPLETLGQVRKYLVADGRLILCVPFETRRRYRRYRPNDINQHLYSWNVLTLGNLVTAAGYHVEQAGIHPFGYEQRLSAMAHLGMAPYQWALRIIRNFLPENEVMLIGRKRG